MTTAPVTSISDELLAEIEAAFLEGWNESGEGWNAEYPCSTSSQNQIALAAIEFTQNERVSTLITRLRAAERDAGRYRWLRDRVPGSAYRIAGVIYSEGGAGVDTAIDAAMPREAEK